MIERILINFALWLHSKTLEKYTKALVLQAVRQYRTSQVFKNRWHTLGLEAAECYDAFEEDILPQVRLIPVEVKVKLFIDSMILRLSGNSLPFYAQDNA